MIYLDYSISDEWLCCFATRKIFLGTYDCLHHQLPDLVNWFVAGMIRGTCRAWVSSQRWTEDPNPEMV